MAIGKLPKFSQPLSWYKGDGQDWTITIKSSGVAVNVTGYTASFMVKSSIEDADGDAKFTVSATLNTPATDGKLNFSVTSANTTLTPGKYVGEYKITPSGGKVFRVRQDVVIGQSVDNP